MPTKAAEQVKDNMRLEHWNNKGRRYFSFWRERDGEVVPGTRHAYPMEYFQDFKEQVLAFDPNAG